jgi:hypothetical protein
MLPDCVAAQGTKIPAFQPGGILQNELFTSLDCHSNRTGSGMCHPIVKELYAPLSCRKAFKQLESIAMRSIGVKQAFRSKPVAFLGVKPKP